MNAVSGHEIRTYPELQGLPDGTTVYLDGDPEQPRVKRGGRLWEGTYPCLVLVGQADLPPGLWYLLPAAPRNWAWCGPIEDAPLDPTQTSTGWGWCPARHPERANRCDRPRGHTGRHYSSSWSAKTGKYHITTVWED